MTDEQKNRRRSALLRMAGNIASGIVTSHEVDLDTEDGVDWLAEKSVAVAEAIYSRIADGVSICVWQCRSCSAVTSSDLNACSKCSASREERASDSPG